MAVGGSCCEPSLNEIENHIKLSRTFSPPQILLIQSTGILNHKTARERLKSICKTSLILYQPWNSYDAIRILQQADQLDYQFWLDAITRTSDATLKRKYPVKNNERKKKKEPMQCELKTLMFNLYRKKALDLLQSAPGTNSNPELSTELSTQQIEFILLKKFHRKIKIQRQHNIWKRNGPSLLRISHSLESDDSWDNPSVTSSYRFYQIKKDNNNHSENNHYNDNVCDAIGGQIAGSKKSTLKTKTLSMDKTKKGIKMSRTDDYGSQHHHHPPSFKKSGIARSEIRKSNCIPSNPMLINLELQKLNTQETPLLSLDEKYYLKQNSNSTNSRNNMLKKLMTVMSDSFNGTKSESSSFMKPPIPGISTIYGFQNTRYNVWESLMQALQIVWT